MAHLPNSPQLFKGTIALLIAIGCFGLLGYLLTPIKLQSEGIESPAGKVMVVRPAAIGPRELRA